MLVTEIKEVKKQIREWRKQELKIGFVPTMGALHEGHESLIKRAVKENDKVVVSVFVNPTQFGPNEDYDSYPRNIEKDLEVCRNAGADMIFHPAAEELYFENKSTFIQVEGLTNVLCGAKRPGHFDGVCLVVSKLFHIVTPDRAYFGQKDAQQVAVLKRMVRDLNMDVEIIPCPIVRESDGLAKSSRNLYLSETERKAALVLSKSLEGAKEQLRQGERDTDKLKKMIIATIQKEPLAKIDYVEIVDAEELTSIQGVITRNVLVPIAVHIGKTRLIDNFIFEV